MNLPQRPSHDLQANLRSQDGYHFPKSVLSAFENPERAFRRRGAPFTYDADAFVKLVVALRTSPVTASDAPQLAFRVPSFDHSIQDPVQNDIYVSSSDRIVILEGNYLLLDEEPWNVIAKLADEKYVELTQIHPLVIQNYNHSNYFTDGLSTSRPKRQSRGLLSDIFALE
jgi:pantothenate kinase